MEDTSTGSAPRPAIASPQKPDTAEPWHDPRWRQQKSYKQKEEEPRRDHQKAVSGAIGLDDDEAALTVVRIALSAHAERPLSPTVYRGLVGALAEGPLASARLRRHPTVVELRHRLSLGFLPDTP